MAHTNLICIGEAKGYGEVTVAEIFFDLIYFAADVSAGPAYIGQEFSLDSFGQYCRFCFVHKAIIAYNCYEYEE